jgi:endonuclease/exonuclease/phosphatase family metal-dependent hydrolase
MKKLLLILAVLAIGATTTASAQKVRVMSYNVKNGSGKDGIKDIKRCGNLVREVQPDVVAVQELDSCTRRNKFYVLGRMAEAAGGYHAYYGPTIPHSGGKYGIGVLTKEPALSVEFHRLPCPREPRGLLVVELKKYYILCTHLSLKEAQRVESVGIIKEVVSKLKNKPVFIAGDMNARPGSAPIVAFKEYAQLLTDDSKFTFPSNDPRVCIDYIFGVNGLFKVSKYHVFYDSLYSDHLPIYVDVKMGKPKKAKKSKK